MSSEKQMACSDPQGHLQEVYRGARPMSRRRLSGWIPRGAFLSLTLALFATGLPLSTARAQTPGATIGTIQGPSEADEGESLAFSVSIIDPSGQAAEFEWDFGDGTVVAGEGLRGVSHEFLNGEEQYEVTVRVSPASGGTQTRSHSVLIRNAEPQILLMEALSEPDPAVPVDFRAEAIDPGDDDLTYRWDFGDGSPLREGQDLRHVTHRFETSAPVTVTLEVSDPDGLVATRTIRLGARGLWAEITGSKVLTVEGLPQEPDYAGVSSAVGPYYGPNADACLYNITFFDDANRTAFNALFATEPGQGLQPGTFTFINPMTDLEAYIDPWRAIGNFVIAQSDRAYSFIKSGSATGQVIGGGGGGGLLDRARNLINSAREAPQFLFYELVRGPTGLLPPFMFTPEAWSSIVMGGHMQIEQVRHTHFSGQFRLALGGMEYNPEGGGEPFSEPAEITGSFSYPLSSLPQALQDYCGESEGFRVESHTPEVEQKGVDFLIPSVRITFTERLEPTSVTAANLEVGIRTAGGQFQPLEGRLTVSSDQYTVVFEAEEPLTTGRYHHVRVRGGQGGVLNERREPLPDDYQFRFGTVLRVVPEARGSG